MNNDKSNIGSLSDCKLLPLTEYANNAIIDNLQLLKNNFNEILILKPYNDQLFSLLKNKYPNATIDLEKQDISSLNPKYYDLIVSSLHLHTSNNISQFLLKIKSILNNNGMFIGNFVGNESLKNLKRTIIEAESFANSGYNNHIYPFIKFEQTVTLFQNTGFKEIITNYETIYIEYDSAYHLMQAIKAQNYNKNIINKTPYSINKTILDILKNHDVCFKDKLDLISFVACNNKGTLKL